MSNELIQRPQAEKGKIHSKNEFELCYIRHQYFRKTTYNPSEEQMAPYMAIVKNLSRRTFWMYHGLFLAIGFDIDDMISIGQIHLVNFLGLFALERTADKLENFVCSFLRKTSNEPDAVDILNKNKANFTMFLKQRMEDVVRVCRQKSRNVKGIPVQEHYVFVGSKKPPKFLRELLINHEKYGFKKLHLALFRSIKKKAKTKESIFEFEGMWYVAVPLEKRTLNLNDFADADMDPYDNIHNMNPEQLYNSHESDNYWKDQKELFDNSSKTRKIRLIRSFIRNNKNSSLFAEEIKTAKKMLKSLSNLNG